jgi:hypothetical protein
MLMDEMYFVMKGKQQKDIRLPSIDDKIKYKGHSDTSIRGILSSILQHSSLLEKSVVNILSFHYFLT